MKLYMAKEMRIYLGWPLYISLMTQTSGSQHGLCRYKTRLCPDQLYNIGKLLNLSWSLFSSVKWAVLSSVESAEPRKESQEYSYVNGCPCHHDLVGSQIQLGDLGNFLHLHSYNFLMYEMRIVSKPILKSCVN